MTTTDNGNVWCPPAQTTPEGGNFVISSCRTRLQEFVFGNIDDPSVCTANCGLGQIELLPTSAGGSPAVVHPWIESIGGQTNLANGVSASKALSCILPQGFNGCGFESQLESAYIGLLRTYSPAEAQFGFVEAGWLTVVIFVSDEADCSYNKEWGEIFEADGKKAFWSDPNAFFPTSAVCWNAGVECVGDPADYSACNPVDFAADGSKTNDPSAAVLFPVKRYIDGLAKEGPVLAFGILGVEASGEPFWADVGDLNPAFQDAFGIGPGCREPNPFDDPGEVDDEFVEAIPPVRMWSVLQELGPATGAAHSICAPDYSVALSSISEQILARFQ